jgi:N-acetylglutamate synthase-like GNAT family acetyltransferase
MGRDARRDHFILSTDPALLDLEAVHGFLSTCYWSPGLSRVRMERAIQGSLVWATYDTLTGRPSDPSKPALCGFMRVVTDRATFAYLCDVFVLEAYRGRGLSRWMLEHVVACPDLQGIRRFSLLTRDAHGLYAKFGFAPAPDPSRYMERRDADGYKQD